MLKVTQVANRLNLSISKTYELIKQGNLGHYRLGGAIRVSEQQLVEYLETTRCEPTRRRVITKTRPRLKHLNV